MKRLLLVGLLALAARPSTSPMADPDFIKHIVEFDKQYVLFLHDLYGCPAHVTDASQCDPTQTRVNYSAYFNASKLVGKVFPQ